MAAAYVMEYHEEHGLCPIMPDFRISTDTLMVGRNLPFDRIADILKIDKETVKFYNPQYKREIIPGDVRPSILRLPMSDLYAHLESKDSLYASRLDTLMALCQPSVTDSEQTDRRNEKITHTVNTGENVYSIANLYGVTAQNLRKWNGLGRNTKLKKGRKLVIHIDNGGLNYYTASNNKTTTAAPTSVASMASTRTSNSNKTGTNNSGYISYTVKSGDTLSSIASKYKGVTIRKIQSANGMTDTRLKIGQILKIPQV
jgi:membrane-bound lytic murein transglycosylase D